jgi:hypothetical protein
MKTRIVGTVVIVTVSSRVTPQSAYAGSDFRDWMTITQDPLIDTEATSIKQFGVGNWFDPPGGCFNQSLSRALGVDVIVGRINIYDPGGFGSCVEVCGSTTITVDLAIEDYPSNQVGHFAFTAVLSGHITSDNGQMASSCVNPYVATSQTQMVGATEYSVRIIPVKALTAPDTALFSGSIGLPGRYSVNMTDAAVPRAATLVILGVGGLGVLVDSRRRPTAIRRPPRDPHLPAKESH